MRFSLRPREAHWFEAYVPRAQTVSALEALAGTGLVELDRDIVPEAAVDTTELRRLVAAIERVRRNYVAKLPAVQPGRRAVLDKPEAVARQALGDLRRWCAVALRLERRLQARRREQEALTLLEECLEAVGEDCARLRPGEAETGFLYKRVFACPLPDTGPPSPQGGVHRNYLGAQHSFRVVADLPEQRAAFEQEAAARGCRPVDIPGWVAVEGEERSRQLAQRQGRLRREIGALQGELAVHRRDPALHQALIHAALLRWYVEQVVAVTADRQRCHVTGWTLAEDPAVLQTALRRAGVDAVMLLRAPPPGRRPPVSLAGSGWTTPFRFFVHLAGTPGRAEIDPTPLLAVIVPLLFGYMFPDVGHGLVLLLAGLVLRRSRPAARFLVPCGLAAAAFGVVFGEVFGLHGVVPALWLSPLEEPLILMTVPLAFGAGLMLLGLVFSAFGAYWRGALGEWFRVEAAVLTLYIGAPLALVWRPAVIAVAAAAVWYLWGYSRSAVGPLLGRLAAAVGRLLSSTAQLALHTLSFVRVGAFALAHAALSSALLQLAEPIEHPVLGLAVLVLGHLCVILLEGLVVFVQTTRLVLFEFFVGFLRAEGRLFRPLPLPTP